MAIIGYDAEKEEVPNDQKIKNCFTLSIMMLVGMPLVGFVLYFLKNRVIDSGRISEEGGKQLFSGYVIIAIFLTIGIIFTLLYLRRKLKQEEIGERDREGAEENVS
ncbi:MAG: tellurite resistance protein TehA-like permease [Saprospiraceae bacterium]|jgi:tellurite resistance protein TehA-like permease